MRFVLSEEYLIEKRKHYNVKRNYAQGIRPVFISKVS